MPDDNNSIYDDIEVIELDTTYISIDEIEAENSNNGDYSISDFSLDVANVGVYSIKPTILNWVDNANGNYLMNAKSLEMQMICENKQIYNNLIGDLQTELNKRITTYDNLMLRSYTPEARSIIIQNQTNARMALKMTSELKNANWNDPNEINRISRTYQRVMDDDSEINRTVKTLQKKIEKNPFKSLSRGQKALRCMSKFLNGLLKAINFIDTIEHICKAISYYWDGDKKKGDEELTKAIQSGMWNLAGVIGLAIVALTGCLVLIIGFIILLVAVDYILCDDEEGILERLFNQATIKAAEVSEPWFDKVIHEISMGLFGTRGFSPQNIFGF